MKGGKESGGGTVEDERFPSTSFARQEEFAENTQLMADLVFNYSDRLKTRGLSRWLFRQMPSHSVLGDGAEEPGSENNAFGLLICQLANCK